MITLGGITLPNDMYIVPAHGWTGVVAEVERSLGSSLIIWENNIQGGEVFDLVCTASMGWISYSVLMQIKALASVAKATYTLVYRTETFTVRFRSEDPPVLDIEPIIPRKERTDDSHSYFFGKIKLFVLP
ncbi:MAG: hypothetical protein EHM49_00155 [Deltaproteobacteria bacterium]|nr:MAG: hypothetical protein EHM49_00155 [Deltaproteobacteria bacterium]